MNLRKKLIAGALALGLLGSVIAPSVINAQTLEDTTYVVVSVADGGAFDAYFCLNTNGAYTLSTGTDPLAHTAGDATGTLTICYTDTKTYRGGFNAQIQSGPFTSPGSSQNTPIAPSNFTIVKAYNVGQLHWSSETAHTHPGWIGDIGFFVDNADPNGQSTSDGIWTPSSATLDVARTIHFSYNGIGTGGAGGDFDVKLNIPGGTSAGTYASTLSLTLMPVNRGH
jgi:hypothetical protein